MQSKRTWTFHKSHFVWKFTGKMPHPHPPTSSKHRAFYCDCKNPSVWPHCLGKKALRIPRFRFFREKNVKMKSTTLHRAPHQPPTLFLKQGGTLQVDLPFPLTVRISPSTCQTIGIIDVAFPNWGTPSLSSTILSADRNHSGRHPESRIPLGQRHLLLNG